MAVSGVFLCVFLKISFEFYQNDESSKAFFIFAILY